MTDTLIRPLKLRVCDTDNKPDSIVNLYTSLTYTERFANRDSFEFTISRKAANTNCLLPGRVVLVPKDSSHDTMRALIIKQIQVSDTTITVSGNDYLWDLLTARLVLDGTIFGTGYDTQTGIAETVARHYIETNLTSAADVRRRDEMVQLEPAHTTPAGTEVSVEGRFQTLQEILESVCVQGGIGIEGTLIEDQTAAGWHIDIHISAGIDRSQT